MIRTVLFRLMKSAEVYDIVKNSWKNLSEMPEIGVLIT